MKINKDNTTRLVRVFTIGTGLSVAILGAPLIQAEDSPSTTPPVASSATKISHQAKEFLEFAAQANQTEIAMADIAESKSQNSQVKDFARMMRSDHQMNYAQVQQLAQTHGLSLDASLDLMNKHAVNRLQKVNEADFDKDYTKVMLKDHVHCINKFNKAALKMDEADVKSYASSTLPALRKHLQHAEDTARAMGLDESTISSILKELPSGESAQAVTANQ